MASAMRRASHSREAEVVPLMTSLASTGMATGLATIGSRITTAAITQLLPYPVFGRDHQLDNDLSDVAKAISHDDPGPVTQQ